MKDFTLFVDMDGTVATWKEAPRVEVLYEKGYFRNLPPYKEVIAAVKQMQNIGIKVFVLSAYLPDSEHAWREKHEWLDKHMPFIGKDHRLLCPQGIPKPEYVTRTCMPIDDSCFLLDDYSKNLHEWKAAGGTGVKLVNGVNGTNGTWTGPAVSRYSGTEAIIDGVFNVWHDLCLQKRGNPLV